MVHHNDRHRLISELLLEQQYFIKELAREEKLHVRMEHTTAESLLVVHRALLTTENFQRVAVRAAKFQDDGISHQNLVSMKTVFINATRAIQLGIDQPMDVALGLFPYFSAIIRPDSLRDEALLAMYLLDPKLLKRCQASSGAALALLIRTIHHQVRVDDTLVALERLDHWYGLDSMMDAIQAICRVRRDAEQNEAPFSFGIATLDATGMDRWRRGLDWDHLTSVVKLIQSGMPASVAAAVV